MDRSFGHEVVFELPAVSESLSGKNNSEDGNHNVVNVVLGVLNNGVSKKQDNSDILEAV